MPGCLKCWILASFPSSKPISFHLPSCISAAAPCIPIQRLNSPTASSHHLPPRFESIVSVIGAQPQPSPCPATVTGAALGLLRCNPQTAHTIWCGAASTTLLQRAPTAPSSCSSLSSRYPKRIHRRQSRSNAGNRYQTNRLRQPLPSNRSRQSQQHTDL